MKSLLRSWRIWWLALALVAAPQLSLVHALSHLAPGAGAITAEAGDEAPGTLENVCETCLLLAQIGPAFPPQATWAGLDLRAAAPVAEALTQIAPRAPAHFQARAPPVFL